MSQSTSTVKMLPRIIIGETRKENKFLKCCVKTCSRKTYEDLDYAYFLVPPAKFGHWKETWLKTIGRKDLTHILTDLYVCEKHFQFQDIQNTSGVKYLKDANVLPSLYLHVSDADAGSFFTVYTHKTRSVPSSAPVTHADYPVTPSPPSTEPVIKSNFTAVHATPSVTPPTSVTPSNITPSLKSSAPIIHSNIQVNPGNPSASNFPSMTVLPLEVKNATPIRVISEPTKITQPSQDEQLEEVPPQSETEIDQNQMVVSPSNEANENTLQSFGDTGQRTAFDLLVQFNNKANVIPSQSFGDTVQKPLLKKKVRSSHLPGVSPPQSFDDIGQKTGQGMSIKSSNVANMTPQSFGVTGPKKAKKRIPKSSNTANVTLPQSFGHIEQKPAHEIILRSNHPAREPAFETPVRSNNEAEVPPPQSSGTPETTDVKVNDLPDILELCKSTQLKQWSESKNKKRYSVGCYILYHASPACYRILSDTMCLMPVSEAHRNVLMPMSTKISSEWNALKYKFASFKAKELDCYVSVSIVPIKHHIFYNTKYDWIHGFVQIDGVQNAIAAQYVAIAIAHGLHANWSQPLQYACLETDKYSDEIQQWLRMLLDRLKILGLQVHAFVTDVKDDILTEAHSVGIKKQFIKHNALQVWCFSDVSTFMSALLACFMENCVIFGKKTAIWSDVVQYYTVDEGRISPELKEEHLQPELDDESFKVIFNKNVAKGMSLYIDLNMMPARAKGTVELLIRFADLYEVLTDTTINPLSKSREFFNGKMTVKNYVQEMLKFTSTLAFLTKDFEVNRQAVNLFLNLQSTLKSYLCLCLAVSSQNGKNAPFTTPNLDYARVFLNKITNKNSTKLLTARKIIAAVKRNYRLCLMKHPERRIHDEVDSFHMALEKVVGHVRTTIFRMSETVLIEMERNYNIKGSDYKDFDALTKHSPYYVAGYIIVKCFDNHKSCSQLQNIVFWCAREIEPDTANHYKIHSSLISHKTQGMLAIVPPDYFYTFIVKLEEVYLNYTSGPIKKVYVLTELLSLADKVTCSPFCGCFPIDFAKMLFFRLRLYVNLKSCVLNKRRELFEGFDFN